MSHVTVSGAWVGKGKGVACNSVRRTHTQSHTHEHAHHDGPGEAGKGSTHHCEDHLLSLSAQKASQRAEQKKQPI